MDTVRVSMVLSIIAVVLSAGGIGYAATIAGDAQNAIRGVKEVSSDLQSFRSDLKKVNDDTKAIRDLVQGKLGQLEETVKATAEFDPNLVAAARKEGKLLFYSVWDTTDLLRLTQAFQKRFPFIQTEFWSAGNPEIIARIDQEAKTGTKAWDVYGAALETISQPANMGYTQDYCSPQATKENFPVLHPKCQWNSHGASIGAVIYNTQLVKKEDLPKTWEDVANPKWKGKIALDNPTRGGPFGSVLAELKTAWNDETRWNNYLKGLVALGAPQFKSTSQIARLVISGEYAIAAVGLLHDALREKAERNSPIDYVQLDPVVVQAQGLVISKIAPHPNVAKLFVEWMLSPEGQITYSETWRSPLRFGVPTKMSPGQLFPGAKQVGFTNLDYWFEVRAFSQKFYAPLFGS